MILLSITILVLTGSRPLKAIVDFVFCTDIVKPYSVVIWFSLCAAFCRLSSVSAILRKILRQIIESGYWRIEMNHEIYKGESKIHRRRGHGVPEGE